MAEEQATQEEKKRRKKEKRKKDKDKSEIAETKGAASKPIVPADRESGKTAVVDAFAYDPTKKNHQEPEVDQASLLAVGVSPWHLAK